MRPQLMSSIDGVRTLGIVAGSSEPAAGDQSGPSIRDCVSPVKLALSESWINGVVISMSQPKRFSPIRRVRPACAKCC